MGLDTTHDAWHGAYSAFNRWRQEIAYAAGLPPLELMEGFFYADSGRSNPFWDAFKVQDKEQREGGIWRRLPISWDCLRPSPLHNLLNHSDCDGDIKWEDCGPIADELEKILPNLEGDGGGHIGPFKEKTKQFIEGLRLAYKNKENLEFH